MNHTEGNQQPEHHDEPEGLMEFEQRLLEPALKDMIEKRERLERFLWAANAAGIVAYLSLIPNMDNSISLKVGVFFFFFGLVVMLASISKGFDKSANRLKRMQKIQENVSQTAPYVDFVLRSTVKDAETPLERAGVSRKSFQFWAIFLSIFLFFVGAFFGLGALFE